LSLLQPLNKNKQTLDFEPWTLDFMIPCTEKDGKLTFKVRVVPRSSRNEIVGEHDGALRVRLTAPPVEGAANAALVRTLARAFDVSPGAVEIISGQGSRTKTVSIVGVGFPILERLLQT
jgi:uncharacterized protein (TIGR00251 family)